MTDETTQTDAEAIDPTAMIRELASMMITYPHYSGMYNRAICTIDALTAERDDARAELARLREACKGVPDMLDDAAKDYSPRFRAKAADIRAALDAPEKE